MRLSGSGLTVRHDAEVVAVEEERNEWRDRGLEDGLLVAVVLKDVFKVEPLARRVGHESQVGQVVGSRHRTLRRRLQGVNASRALTIRQRG